MTKRELPAADATVKPGFRSDIKPVVFERWRPEIRAAAADSDESDPAVIDILDVIGSDWFGEGVTAQRVNAELKAAGERDVTVNINSPGGDYFEGLAIYNLLREHPTEVTVKILGLAASAASVIAMAGDEVRIARAGFLMIHNTWVIAIGDRNGLREIADWLEPFDATAADIYAARSGLAAKEISAMLDRETWLGGSQAVDKGFADALLPSDEIVADAKARADKGALKALREFEQLLARVNVPRAKRRELLKQLKGDMPGAVPTGMQDAALVAGVEDLLQSLRHT